MFQHTAARRRLRIYDLKQQGHKIVSTHSRPKAAAKNKFEVNANGVVSTHSHPKVAADNLRADYPEVAVSTHSHPKAAASILLSICFQLDVSTHSHPKAAAMYWLKPNCSNGGFNTQPPEGGCTSTIISSLL